MNDATPYVSNIFIAALPLESAQKDMIVHIKKHEGNLSTDVPIGWTASPDLHITLGYIRDFESEDSDAIIKAFDSIRSFDAVQTTIIAAKMYGTAICLSLQPHKHFYKMHQHLSKALSETLDGKYEFSKHEQFDPHITIGRTRLKHRRKANKHQREIITQWARKSFKDYHFNIESCALMTRDPSFGPQYKRLATYPLNQKA